MTRAIVGVGVPRGGPDAARERCAASQQKRLSIPIRFGVRTTALSRAPKRVPVDRCVAADRLLHVAQKQEARCGAVGGRMGSVRFVHSLVRTRDEDITGVAGFWGAAARDAGRKFPNERMVQALSSLPDVRIWAVSEDSSALFALLADEVVFTVGSRDDGNVSVRSKPLDSKRLLVSLKWEESKSIEAGGMAWSTRWVFSYRGEREGRDAWQHIIGSVVSRSRQGRALGRAREVRTRNCFNGWVERQRFT